MLQGSSTGRDLDEWEFVHLARKGGDIRVQCQSVGNEVGAGAGQDAIDEDRGVITRPTHLARYGCKSLLGRGRNVEEEIIWLAGRQPNQATQ